jgi:hypothetical protein
VQDLYIRNPFHRKSEAQMGQGENRPKAQKIEKKNKETSKICDSDLLSDVRCRRANCEGLGGDGLGGSGRRRAGGLLSVRDLGGDGRAGWHLAGLQTLESLRLTRLRSVRVLRDLPISILNCWV